MYTASSRRGRGERLAALLFVKERTEKRVVCLSVLALLVLSLFVVTPARAVTTFGPAMVQASPGTVSGGTGPLVASDDIRTTVSEADVTAVSNAFAWLKPDGNTGPNDWVTVGTASGCAEITEFQCVDDDPIQDGDLSAIQCNAACFAATRVSSYTVSNLPATDVALDSVTLFTWSKSLVAPVAGYRVRLDVAGTDCTPDITGAGATTVYANYTVAVTACPGTITPANVNAMTIEHGWDNCPCANGDPLATATGLVVQYDDSDFQVVAYINFTGLSGYGPVLRYEGSRSLSGSDTLQLQVNRDGPDSNPDSWVTLVGNFLSASETGASVTLELVDIQGGSAQFRVVDTVLSDETGESFALDQFVIDTQEDEDPNIGGGDATVRAKFRCDYEWYLRSFSCVSHWPSDPVKVSRLPHFRWWLKGPDGETLATADGSKVLLLARLSPLELSCRCDEFGRSGYKVTIQVFRTDTVTGADASFVVADIPLWADSTPWLYAYPVLFTGLAAGAYLGLRKKRMGTLRKKDSAEWPWPAVPRDYRVAAIDTEEGYSSTTYYFRSTHGLRGVVSRDLSRGTTQFAGVTRSGKLVNVAIRVRESATDTTAALGGQRYAKRTA